MDKDDINNLKATHPMPWAYIIHPNGLVVIMDASGKELPLMTMLEFVRFITEKMK